MKKFAMVSLFALAVLGFASAATTGGIELSGTVPVTMSVALSKASFTDSALSQEGATWDVGTATVISNYKNYTISVFSTNASNLKATIDSTDYLLPYTFVMGDTADGYVFGSATAGIALTGSASPVTKAFTSRTPKVGITYDMKVAVAASGTALWEPGVYTDTITVQIAHP
jgi:hypothetical protein